MTELDGSRITRRFAEIDSRLAKLERFDGVVVSDRKIEAFADTGAVAIRLGLLSNGDWGLEILDPVTGLVLERITPEENIMPVATIVGYGAAAAPTNWLLCDGSAVSRTTYSDLFGVIGTTYGAGNGSTTFNVPDLRQRFPMGKAAAGTGSTLGGTGGSLNAVVVSHNHTQGDHNHTQDAHSHSHDHGATGLVSANHDHGFTSGVQSANHTHGTAGGFATWNTQANPEAGLNTAYPTTVAANTDGQSADHSHSGTTGGQSANHTHTTGNSNVSTTATNQTATGAATGTSGVSGTDANIPPFQVINYIIRAF